MKNSLDGFDNSLDTAEEGINETEDRLERNTHAEIKRRMKNKIRKEI